MMSIALPGYRSENSTDVLVLALSGHRIRGCKLRMFRVRSALTAYAPSDQHHQQQSERVRRVDIEQDAAYQGSRQSRMRSRFLLG